MNHLKEEGIRDHLKEPKYMPFIKVLQFLPMFDLGGVAYRTHKHVNYHKCIAYSIANPFVVIILNNLRMNRLKEERCDTSIRSIIFN